MIGPRVPENIVRERAAKMQSPVFIAQPPPGGTFDDENNSVVELCLETLKTHDPFFKDLQQDALMLDRSHLPKPQLCSGSRIHGPPVRVQNRCGVPGSGAGGGRPNTLHAPWPSCMSVVALLQVAVVHRG